MPVKSAWLHLALAAWLGVTGAGWILASGAPPETAAGEGQAGLVVEAVRQGSTNYRAGIRPGDLLLTWRARPARAAERPDEHGDLRSPFDLWDVVIEQLPRARVVLAGRRGAKPVSWVLPAGSPAIVTEIETRPALADPGGDAGAAVWPRARRARSAMKAGRWEEADALYGEILAPLEKGGSAVAPHLLREWGEALLGRRAFARAESCYQRALALDRQVAAESLAVAQDLSGLGNVANVGGGSTAPESYLRAALALREKLAPGSSEVAASWYDLGFDAYTSHDYPLAAARYERALAQQEKVTPRSLYVAERLVTLATLRFNREEFSSSRALFERARALVEPLAPEDPLFPVILQGLGMSLARQGHGRRAVALLERAFERVARRQPGGWEELDVASDLGLVERRIGRIERGAQHLCRAVDIVESHRRRIERNEEDRLWWGLRFAEVYRDCAAALVAAGRQERAFHVLEEGRSRSLVSFLAERDLRARLPQPLAAERQELAAAYDRIQATLFEEEDEGKRLQLEGRLREIRRRGEELVERARRESPRWAPLPHPEPLDLAATRRALDPGTVLLAYSTAERETLLFVVRPLAGKPAPLPLAVRIPCGAVELRRRIERFRNLLLTPSSPRRALMERAESLYDLLLRPAEPYLAASERILISPDGPLHALPFGALVRQGRYLAEWKPIHSVLSATVYAELQAARRPPGDPRELRLEAFGDPRYPQPATGEAGRQGDARSRAALRQGLTPLPASRREVEAIAALFPHSQVFLGDEATEERAKEIGGEVRLLHFAVHGLLDERLANNSALALSLPESPLPGKENGLLQVWEILGLHLDADLVTLSACQTGLGKETGGEGLLGLTRAFQMAGARSVVATLWAVADDSTTHLMQRFYRHLRQGESKDRALQAAQTEQMRETSHPYYWASFQLYGDWR